jgi:hypothetical protein
VVFAGHLRFIYKNDAFSQLDFPVPLLTGTQTRGINSQDEVVGIYGVGAPPPVTLEPDSVLLRTSGLVGIIILIVRRRKVGGTPQVIRYEAIEKPRPNYVGIAVCRRTTTYRNIPTLIGVKPPSLRRYVGKEEK